MQCSCSSKFFVPTEHIDGDPVIVTVKCSVCAKEYEVSGRFFNDDAPRSLANMPEDLSEPI
jgi:hypothetical protein